MRMSQPPPASTDVPRRAAARQVGRWRWFWLAAAYLALGLAISLFYRREVAEISV